MVDRSWAAIAVTLALLFAPRAFAVDASVVNNRSVADAGSTADKAKPDKTKSAPGEKTAKAAVDRNAELAATELVEIHLPELKTVLKHLRTQQPREYAVAIRDLAKSARRLEVAKNRDERLYDIEVELLQAQSDAKLLTAKLKVRDNEPDRRQLREATRRLQQAEIARVEYEIHTLQERLKKTQQLLDAAQSRLTTRQNEDQLEKSYLNFLRKAGRQPARKSSGK
jgi:hypothetical protein